MKKLSLNLVVALLFPAFASGAGLFDHSAETIIVANMIASPEVKKCLNTFESGEARAVITEIYSVSSVDGVRYFLQGHSSNTEYAFGNWQMTVTSEGESYSCEITQNEE